ncbi:glycosyltransferase family 2 protein [Acinetobacter faecalis]|uniref:glycosyltransferase family 2 protein n=1 Tax=Acinetobacter faecalis TaxID=2665161 RepID=UPI002A920BB7|nr:glycosyltransferase family 2 protein [Acinetobacter faecalis]MDY6484289.1 glycosyltransferase family 2 protein [Acinetobacter faecalis]
MRFSLIIPCYNESANLPLLLERCKKLEIYSDIEIILVDNGSIDDTPKVLKNLLPQYPNCRSIRVEENHGYGFGILSGLKSAKGEILGWTHADMQTDPIDTLIGLQKFKTYGIDIFVKGRRYGRPFSDVLFTVAMSIFESILLIRPMWDINAQPTMFSRKFYESWTSPPDDFSLDLYVYYQARANNLPVYRFPVKFGQRAHGTSNWNINWAAKRKFIRRTINFSLKLKKMM